MFQEYMAWTAMTKNLWGPFAETQEINYRTSEKLAKRNIETGSKFMADCVEHYQKLNSTKKPDEYVKNQVRFMTESLQTGLEHVTAMFAIMQDSLTEYQKVMEKNLDNVFESTKAKSTGK